MITPFQTNTKCLFIVTNHIQKTAKARLSFVISAKKELDKAKSMLLPYKVSQKALAKHCIRLAENSRKSGGLRD